VARHFVGLSVLFAYALLARQSTAQTATGSISGRVISQGGAALHAIVTILPAGPLGFPSGKAHRVLAINNGAFTFAGLRSGQYNLCAQIPASEAPKASPPFLDTCEWGSSHAPIKIASGQQVTGVTITAPPGALLKIQIADPDHILPSVTSPGGPKALEPQLVLLIRGADRGIHHPQFVSQTTAGRNYQAVVPVNTALSTTVASSVANVFDGNGNKITGELPTQAAAGVTPGPLTFTLHRLGN